MTNLLTSIIFAALLGATPPTAITDYGTAGPVTCDGLRCCTTLTARRGAYTYRRRSTAASGPRVSWKARSIAPICGAR